MAFVFLSYERSDAKIARSLADRLEQAGHEVWWDRRIKAGAQFNEEIERALNRADAVVVLWSATSIDSPWVRDEAMAGRDHGRLVPARIDPVQPPLGFRQFQTIDLDRSLKRSSKELSTLLETVAEVTGSPAADEPPRAAARAAKRLDRRAVLAMAGAAGSVAIAGYWLVGRDQQSTPPEVEALLAQAWQSWAQGTSAGNNEAIGLYRRSTEIAPDHADSWGLLGCAYGDRAHAFADRSERPALRDRAKDAGRRALSLDPKNAYGRAAIAYAQPLRGNWLTMEREFRRALDDQPAKWLITYSVALLYTHVGRMSDAVEWFGKLKDSAPTVNQYVFHISSLWSLGRLEEAERRLEEASKIFGGHPRIWTLRFKMLLTGGRAGEALALARDPRAGDTGLPADFLADRADFAEAVSDRRPDLVDRVSGTVMAQARRSSYQASRAIEDLALLGKVDDAFAIASAYFFSDGGAIPDVEPAPGRAAETSLDARWTGFLFTPVTRSMRSDRRFETLMGRIGLDTYWRQSGAVPDYRR